MILNYTAQLFTIIFKILDILEQNATAFISIFGLICGSILTFVFTNITNNRERKWRMNEPSIKLREDIHRQLYKLSCEFSIFITYKREEEMRPTLKLFGSRKAFIAWNNTFVSFTLENSIFFSSEVIRIFKYFQYYQVKLHTLIDDAIRPHSDSNKEELALNLLGELLSEDFIKFGDDFQKASRSYFIQKKTEKIIEEEKEFLEPTSEEQKQFLNKLKLYSSYSEIKNQILKVFQ